MKDSEDSDHWVVFSVQPVISRAGPGDRRARQMDRRIRRVDRRAGQVDMMIVVMADITSLKRPKQERDSWMQALAHDLNSPLAAALLYAKLAYAT